MQQNRHISSYRKRKYQFGKWTAEIQPSQKGRPGESMVELCLDSTTSPLVCYLRMSVCWLVRYLLNTYLYIKEELVKEALFCSLIQVTGYLLWGPIKWKPCKIWCSLTWICSPKNNNRRQLYPPPVAIQRDMGRDSALNGRLELS